MSNYTLSQTARSHATLSEGEVELLKQLRSIRFGHITVQIHDMRIVQIERTEKIRPEFNRA